MQLNAGGRGRGQDDDEDDLVGQEVRVGIMQTFGALSTQLAGNRNRNRNRRWAAVSRKQGGVESWRKKQWGGVGGQGRNRRQRERKQAGSGRKQREVGSRKQEEAGSRRKHGGSRSKQGDVRGSQGDLGSCKEKVPGGGVGRQHPQQIVADNVNRFDFYLTAHFA